MEVGKINAVIRDGIGVIEFYHPKANSLPSSLLHQLGDRIEEFGAHQDVRAVLLCSDGNGAFCAGASFDELRNLSSPAEAEEYFMGFAKVILAIRNSKSLVVTRVQGKAVGGALGVIAVSDYVFASSAASVRLSELAIGLGAFVISEPIIRKIGIGHFSHMCLDTEWRTATWCEQVGLYSKVAEDRETLDAEIQSFLDSLVRGHHAAQRKLKELFWASDPPWAELLRERAKFSGSLALTDWVQQKLRA
ncbi:MAG: enoyl-CoA hydratase/isomerase family protein [Bdellovibrionales bacterium]|nr:enoyl-CoA hydratase/isomerase family protein [Bdellovibrionales bacterium]